MALPRSWNLERRSEHHFLRWRVLFRLCSATFVVADAAIAKVRDQSAADPAKESPHCRRILRDNRLVLRPLMYAKKRMMHHPPRHDGNHDYLSDGLLMQNVSGSMRERPLSLFRVSTFEVLCEAAP
jgi:hypothetical protein